MKCPKCGNPAQSDAIFCDQCGTRLAGATTTVAAAPVVAAPPSAPSVEPQPVAPPVAAPAPYAPVVQAAGSLCAKCGSANTPGELFCAECGAPLETPQPEPQVVPVTPPAPAQPISATGAACPDCGAEVQPADEFCYACGAELKGRVAAAVAAPSAPVAAPVAAPAPAPVQPAVAPEAPAPLTECPSCGADVKPEDTFCAFCGAALVSAAATTVVAAPSPAPQPVAPAPSAPAAAGPTTAARLVLQPSGIELPLPQGQEIIIGREDPFSGVFPDIDLTPHGAEEGGISRRHLRIRRVAGGYTAEDLNSTNYTFVNRVQLKPGQPVALGDGDEVRAGRIRLLFRTGS